MKNKVYNKRKLYHQLVCLFFFLSIKPALTNLDNLDYVVMELLLRKKIKCDQHIAVSSLYFFFKPIVNNLKVSFQELRTSFFTSFLLEHRLFEDVFLGAPSEGRPQQTECV